MLRVNKKGQGLVEYILIVALMGIIAIASINALSNETTHGYRSATNRLSTEFARIDGD